jgi:hypothetical protein
MHKLTAMVGVLMILVLTGCSDDGDPAGDGALRDSNGGFDALLWPDAPVKLDAKPWACTGTSTTECGGKKTMFCEGGFCKPCPVYYYNCDKQGVCECAGACDGAKCVGTRTTCKFDDKEVCSGNTAMYCVGDTCTACPTGKTNCDKTKDCECTGVCAGKKCK